MTEQLDKKRKIITTEYEPEKKKKISHDTLELENVKYLNETDIAEISWIEKYNPVHSKDIIGNTNLIRELKNFLAGWSSKNIKHTFVVLSGKPGVGKTTSINVISREYNFEKIEINGSSERNKEDLKKIINMASSKLSVPSVLVIEEIDGMKLSIPNFRDIVKSSNMPVVFISNEAGENKYIRPIIEYTKNNKKGMYMEFKTLELKDVIARATYVCKQENLKIEPNELRELCLNLNNDMRSILNNLQFYKNGYSSPKNSQYTKRLYTWLNKSKNHEKHKNDIVKEDDSEYIQKMITSKEIGKMYLYGANIIDKYADVKKVLDKLNIEEYVIDVDKRDCKFIIKQLHQFKPTNGRFYCFIIINVDTMTIGNIDGVLNTLMSNSILSAYPTIIISDDETSVFTSHVTSKINDLRNKMIVEEIKTDLVNIKKDVFQSNIFAAFNDIVRSIKPMEICKYSFNEQFDDHLISGFVFENYCGSIDKKGVKHGYGLDLEDCCLIAENLSFGYGNDINSDILMMTNYDSLNKIKERKKQDSWFLQYPQEYSKVKNTVGRNMHLQNLFLSGEYYLKQLKYLDEDYEKYVKTIKEDNISFMHQYMYFPLYHKIIQVCNQVIGPLNKHGKSLSEDEMSAVLDGKKLSKKKTKELEKIELEKRWKEKIEKSSKVLSDMNISWNVVKNIFKSKDMYFLGHLVHSYCDANMDKFLVDGVLDKDKIIESLEAIGLKWKSIENDLSNKFGSIDPFNMNVVMLHEWSSMPKKKSELLEMEIEKKWTKNKLL